MPKSKRHPSTKALNLNRKSSKASSKASSKPSSPGPLPSNRPRHKAYRDSPLSRLHTLLSHLHHRNKNQHRSQPFFKHLNLLRRGIRALFELEVGDATDLQTISSSSSGAEKVRDAVGRRRARSEKREAWETYLRERVVPAAYVSFTAVVGTNQFAGLGVMLVALVGDVAGVVGLPTQSPEVDEDTGNVVGTECVEEVLGISMRQTGMDRGEVVERVYKSGSQEAQEMMADAVDLGVVVKEGEEAPESGERVVGAECIDEHGAGITQTTDTANLSLIQDSNSVKKRTKGNAIDDLFAGL